MRAAFSAVVVWLLVCLLVTSSAKGWHSKPQAFPQGKHEHCPAHPDIPEQTYNLPSDLVEQAVRILRPTIAPCTHERPTQISATSFSGGILVGNVSYFINLGCVDKNTPSVVPTVSTLYRIGSLSKVFAVDLVLRALHKGLIRSLDDEVQLYHPKFVIENPFEKKQPTWRQMASQLAGMPRMGPCNTECPETTDTMLDRIATYMRLMSPANTMPSYSNLAYAILGNIVAEKLFGKNYSEALRAEILAPLRMLSTGLDPTPEALARLAKLYGPDGSEVPWQKLGWYAPSGAIYTSSTDMLTFLGNMLREWQAYGWRREAMQPLHINGDQTTGWGMPWELRSSNGFLYRCKDGAVTGARAVMLLVPELQFAFWGFWNGEGMDIDNIAVQVADIIVPKLVDAYTALEAKNFPKPAPQFLEQFLGKYSGMGVDAEVLQEGEGSNTNVKIVVDAAQLNAYLRPSKDPFKFQLWNHRHREPCTMPQFDATIGSWGRVQQERRWEAATYHARAILGVPDEKVLKHAATPQSECPLVRRGKKKRNKFGGMPSSGGEVSANGGRTKDEVKCVLKVGGSAASRVSSFSFVSMSSLHAQKKEKEKAVKYLLGGQEKKNCKADQL